MNEFMPEIGSRQSAVMAFTNMMAAALDESEKRLIFWLDAYYQLRHAFEEELLELEAEAELIRQEAEEEENRKIREDIAAMEAAIAAPAKSKPKPAKQEQKPEAPKPEAPKKDPAVKFAEIEDPVEMKRCVLEKLQDLRRAGWSGPRIQKLTSGKVGITTVYGMLRSSPVSLESWKSMAKALDKLEMREAIQNGKQLLQDSP